MKTKRITIQYRIENIVAIFFGNEILVIDLDEVIPSFKIYKGENTREVMLLAFYKKLEIKNRMLYEEIILTLKKLVQHQ